MDAYELKTLDISEYNELAVENEEQSGYCYNSCGGSCNGSCGKSC